MQYQIRQARSGDFDSLARIYSESILGIGHEHYSPAQVETWASYSFDTEAFQDWVSSAMTLVAVNSDGVCLGFGGLEPNGRICSLFVAPGFMRRGVASNLLEKLMDEARSRGFHLVTTDASAFSRTLFEKFGFRVIEVEHTRFKGVDFDRYAMQAKI